MYSASQLCVRHPHTLLCKTTCGVLKKKTPSPAHGLPTQVTGSLGGSVPAEDAPWNGAPSVLLEMRGEDSPLPKELARWSAYMLQAVSLVLVHSIR